MARHVVYQIGRQYRNLSSSAVFYGFGASFTQVHAKQAFKDKKYTNVAVLEANSLEEVRQLINTNRESTKIVQTPALRNINIGDIIHNEETQLYYIVSPTGFDRIKI